MNKSQLNYILTLAKLQNFSKAAEACYVSQSTLSAMVSKLEDHLGIEIFNRKTRPISITPQGEEILGTLKRIYHDFEVLDEVVNQIRGKEVGQLKIACIPTVAPYLYPLIIKDLTQQFKKVDLSMFELTTENIIEEILVGNIDIGIVSIPLENKELIEYHLYNEAFYLYDCGKQKAAGRFSASEIDLDRLWLLEEGHCIRNQVGKICELRSKHKIDNRITYNCGSIYTLIEMVKQDQGLTLLPKLAISNNPQISNKKIYKLEDPVPVRAIGLITRRNFVKKRVLNQLMDIIKSRVEPKLQSDDIPFQMVKPV